MDASTFRTQSSVPNSVHFRGVPLYYSFIKTSGLTIMMMLTCIQQPQGTPFPSPLSLCTENQAKIHQHSPRCYNTALFTQMCRHKHHWLHWTEQQYSTLALTTANFKAMMDSPTFLQDMLAGQVQRVDQMQFQHGGSQWRTLKDPLVRQIGLASKN